MKISELFVFFVSESNELYLTENIFYHDLYLKTRRKYAYFGTESEINPNFSEGSIKTMKLVIPTWF